MLIFRGVQQKTLPVLFGRLHPLEKSAWILHQSKISPSVSFGKKANIDLGDCLRPTGSQWEDKHHYGTFRDLYEPSFSTVNQRFGQDTIHVNYQSIRKQGHRSAVNQSIWRSPKKTWGENLLKVQPIVAGTGTRPSIFKKWGWKIKMEGWINLYKQQCLWGYWGPRILIKVPWFLLRSQDS